LQRLPPLKPESKLILIDLVLVSQDFEGAHAHKYISSVALCSWHTTKRAIDVLAAEHKVSRFDFVDLIQLLQKR